MQTFLPYPDPRWSAAALDDRRLGKQRVEVLQVLRALVWERYGWRHHPAVRMWRGFVPALVAYGVAVCDEWVLRSRADAVRGALLEFTAGREPDPEALLDGGELPPWLGDEAFHASHRAVLARKDPGHYRPLFPDVPDDVDYTWPAPAFPRWPLRRDGALPLDLDAAARLLGVDEPTPDQRRAVDAVRDGDDVRLRLDRGAGATTAALLAGLCTPGTTLWVRPGDPPRIGDPVPPALRRGAPGNRPPGRLSPSVARQPTAADLAAMAAETAARPEFRFLRPGQLDARRAGGAGLVVVDARTTAAGVAVPDLGLPLLVLDRPGES